MREADFFVSALNPALILLNLFFCSLVNGTLPLKILSAHSDHGTSTPNVSQENAIFPVSLFPSYGQTSRLHGDRYETKHAGYPEIKNLHLSRC
jgi:hypothetical protein